MTANFDMIQKFTPLIERKLKERKVVNRPMTYAEKILYAHLWEPATVL